MEVSLATVPYLIRWSVCACVLTVRVETHIYWGTKLVSQIESKGVRLSVSASDCICMRINEMLYDYGTLNKAKRVDSLSYIPHT